MTEFGAHRRLSAVSRAACGAGTPNTAAQPGSYPKAAVGRLYGSLSPSLGIRGWFKRDGSNVIVDLPQVQNGKILINISKLLWFPRQAMQFGPMPCIFDTT
jgi:hypothetical protein